MYKLTVESEVGDRLQLTGNRNYDVLDVSGTSPPAANINVTSIVNMDGAKFNSALVGTRNLVITLNIHHPIEENRIALYRVFKPKRKVRVWYENHHRKVYIDGYVETFENNPWTQLQQPQISIICPQPFWLADAETVVHFSKSIALFEFPFSIPEGGIEFSQLEVLATAYVDVGEIRTGGIIRMEALKNGIVNPKFINQTLGQFIQFDLTMQVGDVITVNTRQGQKSATLLREGATTSLMSSRSAGSDWVQFEAGVNELAFDASSGADDLSVSVTILRMYEGV